MGLDQMLTEKETALLKKVNISTIIHQVLVK